MSINNDSKIEFRNFIKFHTTLKKCNEKRQVFYFNGDKFGFSVSSDMFQCRQFYEDCKGFVTLSRGDNKYYLVMVPDPKKYQWSRATKQGINAYSVCVGKDQAQEFKCS